MIHKITRHPLGKNASQILAIPMLILTTIGSISCTKDHEADPGSLYSDDIRELEISPEFSFRTNQEVAINVEVKDLEDQELNGVRVNFYSKDPIEGGNLLASAISYEGIASTKLILPQYQQSIFVEVAFPGFANTRVVDVKPSLSLQFGGRPKKRNLRKSSGSRVITSAGGNRYFISSFDNQGVPANLEVPGDVLSTQFLSDVNASFPERRPVPTYNPQYLSSGNQMDVALTDISDVYVTFVSEGAGYRNVLAYYTYDTGNPPQSPSNIDSLFIIFPNASFSGSGGGLNAGDKVHLGRFPAGKTISWALIANGWNNGTLSASQPVYYANPALNTLESNPAKRQHSVQLLDASRQLLLNGFEDLPRSNNSSDDDFNDLMFYVSATPWTAVSTGNIPPTAITYDTDGDGVPDDVDDFPQDPLRAYTVNYPGSLAFEDLWPSQGDYDFNDLVIDYEIEHVCNAANKVMDLNCTWTVEAVGSPFKNGFGFQFENVLPTDVQSVSGQVLSGASIVNNPNGTEAGQQRATIIGFDNVFSVIPNPGTKFINTVENQAKVNPESLNLTVNFSSAVALSDLGLPPYNPFIYIKQNRGQEVHLPGSLPTDLADPSFFGSADDDTDPGVGKYYKTANNLPWALNISGDFDYPAEYEPINHAYLKFAPWAMSDGMQYQDWFEVQPGYRDMNKIY